MCLFTVAAAFDVDSNQQSRTMVVDSCLSVLLLLLMLLLLLLLFIILSHVINLFCFDHMAFPNRPKIEVGKAWSVFNLLKQK